MPLGTRVRLRALQPEDLPPHAELASLQQQQRNCTTTITPAAFAAEVIREAEYFATHDWRENYQVKSTGKASPPATAPVELGVRIIRANELPDEVRSSSSPHPPASAFSTSSSSSSGAAAVVETWFGRVSEHENAARPGTATWSEFEGVLLDQHSENECRYTPDIFDARNLLRWDGQALIQDPTSGWTKVEMGLWEMCHNLPAPLQPRLFSVLVLSALKQGFAATDGSGGGGGEDGSGGGCSRSSSSAAAAANITTSSSSSSFLTVQIPVNLVNVHAALYASGRNKLEGETAEKQRDMVAGIYASVERTELIDQGKRTMWSMATASDAGGNLPLWMQKMALPGAVAKDVGYVVGYIEKMRQQQHQR